MAGKLYRDQIERFYDLEELKYSRTDIASLCACSTSLVSIWRRTNPNPADFEERPQQALALPPMRPPKEIPGGKAVPWMSPAHEVKRGVRPGSQPPEPEPPPSPPTTAPSRPKGHILPEKYPPGGKKEAARLGALRPVTVGQLDKAVAKHLRLQKAEMLKEIKAAGFDPAVTWTTEVDHVAFDPIKALVQLAHVPGCPENTILGILRTLVALRKERAKVAWETVKLEDIPQEHRPRLAGQLAEWLHVSELPVEVQEHEAVREVYELTGVALPKPAEAEAFLLRWEQTLEDMRTDAEARTVAERATGRLVMDGPPKVAAEFRVRPSTGTRPA